MHCNQLVISIFPTTKCIALFENKKDLERLDEPVCQGQFLCLDNYSIGWAFCPLTGYFTLPADNILLFILLCNRCLRCDTLENGFFLSVFASIICLSNSSERFRCSWMVLRTRFISLQFHQTH